MSLTTEDQIVVLSAQQYDPVWFVQTILGQFAWSKQRQILESVRDHSRTAVRSGHGIGKTRVAAYTVMWFLQSFPNSRVITTAPTAFQMEHLLWREIGAVWNSSKVPMQGRKLNTKIDISDTWFAIGLSTDEPERFSGQHARHILVVVDEGSGVDDSIYEAAEGYLTTEGGRLLVIGNPTQVTGQFYNAFHRERHLWNCIHVSVFDSPNFTDEDVPDEVRAVLTTQSWVEDKKVKWGEGSPMYQVRVLGDFPSQADNNVFSLADIEFAQLAVDYETAMIDDAVIACDVARFGSDETVISVRQGRKVRIVDTYVGKDTMETVGRIIKHRKMIRSEIPPAIVIDDDGVGGGVTDRLTELGYEVIPFRGGATALQPDEYPNARSELWFTVSDRIREIDLDGDEQLAADLSAPEYKLDSRGRRVVEQKADTKKRIGRSPDRGDSVLLTFAPERGASVDQWSYTDYSDEPVYRKGDLVLKGERYVDRPPYE